MLYLHESCIFFQAKSSESCDFQPSDGAYTGTSNTFFIPPIIEHRYQLLTAHTFSYLPVFDNSFACVCVITRLKGVILSPGMT